MGLFSSRPEDPTEWAGLPSEPLSERSAAEQLTDAAASADLLTFGGGGVTVPLESIVIPVSTLPEPSAGTSDGPDVRSIDASQAN